MLVIQCPKCRWRSEPNPGTMVFLGCPTCGCGEGEVSTVPDEPVTVTVSSGPDDILGLREYQPDPAETAPPPSPAVAVRPPRLQDLFDIGRRDATVQTYLRLWLDGDLTFDQMAVGLVVKLAGLTERLSKDVAELWAKAPTTFHKWAK